MLNIETDVQDCLMARQQSQFPGSRLLLMSICHEFIKHAQIKFGVIKGASGSLFLKSPQSLLPQTPTLYVLKLKQFHGNVLSSIEVLNITKEPQKSGSRRNLDAKNEIAVHVMNGSHYTQQSVVCFERKGYTMVLFIH